MLRPRSIVLGKLLSSLAFTAFLVRGQPAPAERALPGGRGVGHRGGQGRGDDPAHGGGAGLPGRRLLGPAPPHPGRHRDRLRAHRRPHHRDVHRLRRAAGDGRAHRQGVARHPGPEPVRGHGRRGPGADRVVVVRLALHRPGRPGPARQLRVRRRGGIGVAGIERRVAIGKGFAEAPATVAIRCRRRRRAAPPPSPDDARPPGTAVPPPDLPVDLPLRAPDDRGQQRDPDLQRRRYRRRGSGQVLIDPATGSATGSGRSSRSRSGPRRRWPACACGWRGCWRRSSSAAWPWCWPCAG